MRIFKAALAIVVIAQVLAVGASSRGAFPGSNGKVAFETFRTGDNYEVFTVDPDGSDPVNLTNNPAYDKAPAWNADGSKIAFQSARPVNPLGVLNWNIWVMDADGANPVQLTTNNFSEQPTWSPDGTKIAFVRQTSGQSDVWTMNADGSNQVNLTNTSGADQHPSWSPDGSKIAFHSSRDGDLEVFVMDAADGGNVTNLTNNTGIDDRQPDWSPDGTKIAYATGENINIMNVDGSSQAQFVGEASSPTWSPDGAFILFQRAAVAHTQTHSDDPTEIAKKPANGGNTTSITPGAAPSQQPASSQVPGVDLEMAKRELKSRNNLVPTGQPLAPAIPGTKRTFVLTIKNNSDVEGGGAEATNVEVIDVLPPGTQLLEVRGLEGFDCSPDILVPGIRCIRTKGVKAAPRDVDVFVALYTILINTNETIVNTATVSSDQIELDRHDNSATQTMPASGKPLCDTTNTTKGATVEGTPEPDVLCSVADKTTINAQGGNDTVRITGKKATVSGGDGNDTVEVFDGSKKVTVDGGPGNDIIDGNDKTKVDGGEGEDRCEGKKLKNCDLPLA